MKKVGIITYHYINNHGAILQAFALKKAIDKIDGYKAEIINYIPEGFSYSPYETGLKGKERMEAKMAEFHRFLFEICEVKYPPISDISNLNYDIYCVGSDQVWNFSINKGDTTYLLDVIGNEKRKISYASSIGQQVEKLTPYINIFKENLSTFYKVSVREDEHKQWLNDKCEIKSKTVLDPTFLVDSTEYDSIVSSQKLREHPFILFMWYQHDDQLEKAIEFVNTVSRKYNLPIVHNLLNVRPYILAKDGGYMFYEGIENYLWYIKNAKMIVTNSYHTMLFSIHFKRPFYAYLVESMRSRFDTLGDKLGIKDRFVTTYIDPNYINDIMDYEKIYQKIAPYKNESYEYLVDALR